MPAYLVHPELTCGAEPLAVDFFHACHSELEEHVEAVSIRNEMVATSCHPTRDDVLVLFNRPDQDYSPAVSSLLAQAVSLGTSVFPIATDKNCRLPPSAAVRCQSFDVVEELRHRSVTTDQIRTVAIAFARSVVACLQPTLAKTRMQLFVSHRRLDGEEIAASICAQLRVRAESLFRDLIDIRVGDDAQEVIENNLHASDAVIFVDTPLAGESDWIARELTAALSLNLPIVWVRVGPDENRCPLRVLPGTDTPHLKLSELRADEVHVEADMVDKILEKAFQLSRQSARRVFDDLRRIKEIAREHNITLREIDHKNLVYSIDIPRRGFRYRQRPMAHLVQMFGRWPKADDVERFVALADGVSNKQLHIRYDTGLLLAPIPQQTHAQLDEHATFVDSSEEYIKNIVNYIRGGVWPVGDSKRGLIISGAFPDCEPEHQQHVTDAVHSFAKAVLDHRGIVIFGGHPTFQHLILDLARRERPDTASQAVHLYLSKYFITEALLNEYRGRATVYPIEAVDDDRADSLTAMRQAMIANNQALGLVAIGGKTGAGGHLPGVDEEITMARSAGLPVFLVGSAGGRTAELALTLSAQGWKERINTLEPQENQALLESVDYRFLADRVLTAIGL